MALAKSRYGLKRFEAMDAEAVIRRMVAENFDADRAYERLCRDGQVTTTSTIEDGELKSAFVEMHELYIREPDENGGIVIRTEYRWL
jgi:hypothetical protein